jgi:hypothetical protein
MPSKVDPAVHKVFMGVTVRHNENAGKPIRVQQKGVALVRVQGPVAVDDTLGLAVVSPFDVLVKNGPVSVGKALQAIPDATIRVISVRLGAGGGGSQAPTWI